ncbi:MAG: histidine phosphatase family protein [Kineosporiaceae bacterium]
MAQLVLIRHGETEWSLSGKHTGRTDVPLTEHGREQAQALGTALRGQAFALVMTSPLQRARDTAHLAGFVDVEVDDDLVEWDYGGYEGRTTPEIASELGRPWTLFGDGVPAGETPGESLEEVAARAEQVLARVVPLLEADDDVALVGHGHHLRVLTACWLGLPPDAGARFTLDAGTISRLGFEHGVQVIESWNRRP